MKELVERIVKMIVDAPDQVEVVQINGSHTAVLEVHVAKFDIGKVIGKKGRIADALRTIVHAASVATKQHTVLEIIE